MKKRAVVITDGQGGRNFILSDFLAEAEKTFDKVAFLPATVYENVAKIPEFRNG